MLNEMMQRPIVLPKIVDYMRKSQKRFDNKINKLEIKCNENNVPIIPHETAIFLDFQLGILKPKKILEIGTAVGFSSILMSRSLQEDGKIKTIERHAVMYNDAIKNIKDFGLEKKIEVLFGDANDILPKLEESFDFIFMDSAKSKYIEFLPICLNLLNAGGVIVVDDIFQAGTILDDVSEIPRRDRTIHKKLNEFLDFVHSNESLKSTLIPLGDGFIMIQKI